MKKLYATLVILTVLAACTQKTPTIEPHELIGVWECVTGCEADYEFYQTEDNYGFYVYSGQRMYTSGSWELNQHQITLHYDDQQDVSYPIRFKGDTLLFGENQMLFIPAIAAVAPEADEPCPLGYLPDGFLGLEFSSPQPEAFSWHYEAEDSTVEIAQIEGLAIETIVELQGDFSPMGEAFSTIGDYLKILGYESDMFNSSERADGYRMENCVVVILNTWDDWTVEEGDAAPLGEVAIKLLYGKLER